MTAVDVKKGQQTGRRDLGNPTRTSLAPRRSPIASSVSPFRNRAFAAYGEPGGHTVTHLSASASASLSRPSFIKATTRLPSAAAAEPLGGGAAARDEAYAFAALV